MAASRVDAQLEEPRVELRCSPGQAKVTHERQVHAGSHRGTVDRCDRGQRRAADSEEPLVHRPQSLLGGVAEMGQVGAGAERRGCPRDHHRADVVGCLELVEDRDHPPAQVEIERVAPIGVVQGDGGDAVGDVDEDAVWVSHGP